MKRLIIVGVLLASLTTCNADAQTAVSRSGPTFEQINDARLRALATSVVQSRPDYGSLTEADRRYHLERIVRNRQICLEEVSAFPGVPPEKRSSICECYVTYTNVRLTNGELHTMMDGRDFNAITPSIQSKYAAAAKTCFSN